MRIKYLVIIILQLLSLSVSAATYQSNSNSLAFSWSSTDEIAVYTSGGSRLKYYVSAVQSDSHYCRFECGFGIANNMTFYSCSPYNDDCWDRENVPVSYTSQTQSANAATSHLASYDYQMAKFTTGVNTASINFSHIGSVLHFSWTLPTAATVTSLTLSADDNSSPFVSLAAMNLVQQTTSITTKTNSVTLGLNNISIARNGTLHAYLAVYPVNLSGKTITVTLTAANGKTMTTKINGVNILAGKLYPITIGANDFSSSSSKSAFNDTSTTSAASVTAYSPDFSKDTNNVFTIADILGDVNGDHIVNICDVAVLIKHCKARTTSTLNKAVCDVNKDNVINVADVKAIANQLILKK